MVSELFQTENFIFLGQGLIITITIALSSVLLSTVFGTVLGVLRFSNIKILGNLATIYIEVVRNIPLLLFILVIRFIATLPREIATVIYDFFTDKFGISTQAMPSVSTMSSVLAGILAMSIFTSAVVAEIVRGGLNSIPKGQWEGAYSQGLSYIQTLFYIILPQTFRNILPALVSQFTSTIKDTSFVWIVGTEDLTGKGMILMGKYGTSTQVFMLFGMIAMTYFVLNYILSHYSRKLHNSYAHSRA
ncbi:MAG: amino acid ABC transporter permease [Campylobacteraceae bacterium]|jgi:putative glutamine transport system permease protein|nr:amino acid ABC transporter permease [Campylobacteraceae bacterium]